MADTKRKKPYCYVSWITKYLSGESRCAYAPWYKTQHKFEKRPDDFPDREKWIAKHDAITNRREKELLALDYTIRKEDAAEFVLQGTRTDLAGKPDLVAIKAGTAIVVDAKSGKPKQADHWQVLIYMLALPLTWLKGVQIAGEVERNEVLEREKVRPLGEVERNAIIAAVRMAGGENPPEATPGPSECRFCDIYHCQYRYAKPSGDARGMF